MISKGPKYFSEIFFEGLLVWMCCKLVVQLGSLVQVPVGNLQDLGNELEL